MISTLKLCPNFCKYGVNIFRTPSRILQHRNLVTSFSRNLVVRNQPKNFTIITKQSSTNLSIRFISTNVPEKGRKLVGGWLLGCSGMVFVAVILGGTMIYIFLLYSVCLVLGSAISLTSRKS